MDRVAFNPVVPGAPTAVPLGSYNSVTGEMAPARGVTVMLIGSPALPLNGYASSWPAAVTWRRTVCPQVSELGPHGWFGFSSARPKPPVSAVAEAGLTTTR